MLELLSLVSLTTTDLKPKDSSGPVVVDVIPPTSNNTKMGTMQRKRNPSRPRLWIVSALVGMVVIGIWFQSSSNEFYDSEGSLLAVSETLSKKSSSSKMQKYATVDVNAPPVQQTQSSSSSSFWDSLPSQQDDTAAEHKISPFSFWGKQSDILDREVMEEKKTKKTKKAKKQAKLNPIPIVNLDDDKVPQAAAGVVILAADALLCRESIIDYVINATDLKDECDGLKKAFTKNCADDTPEALPQRRRQRRLEEAGTTEQHQENLVIRWQHWLHRVTRRIQHWWESAPTILMVEDELLDEWDNAAFEVDRGWDRLALDNSPYFEDPELQKDVVTYRRRLNEARDFARDEKYLDEKEQLLQPLDRTHADPPVPVAGTSNKTGMSGTKEKQKLQNLALPTNLHHVSEKMLSETLLLQQGEKINAANAKAAVRTAVNGTAAQIDAAASAKAVSDTVDFVSNVLNDPTSVEARTCCTSILNVFHENCTVDDDEEISDGRLFIVVAVIAFCGLAKSLIRHFHMRWLPEAAGCILVGVASGWALSFYPHHDLSFDGPFFLRIMVPPIVFEAALSIDKRSFNRHVVPIILYAVVGTLFATGLTAFLLHEGSKYYQHQGYCETIPVIEALTFGSLISSIDPIAVLSVLSNMGMTDTDTIYVVIFGESLLNDGVAIVLFQTLVHFLDVNMTVDSHAVVAAVIHFLVVAIGSLLVGSASGIFCTIFYWLMHGCQTPLVEVLMFCCWALLPYYVCDGIEWSGIVAVVAAGFVMDINVVGQHHSPTDDPMDSQLEMLSPQSAGSTRGPRTKRRAIFMPEGQLSKEAKTHIGFVTEIIATMMETAIFAYLGLFLFSSRYHWNNYHTCLAIGACCISRAIMIPSLSTLANWITKVQQVPANFKYQQLPLQQDSSLVTDSQQKSSNPAGVIIDKKMQLVLWFAGLRGAMSFALVESIPQYDAVTGEGTRFKSELKAMTSACIIFSVFVLGGLTFYMMEGLGMTPSHNKPSDGSSSKLGQELEMMGLLSKKEDKEDYDEFDEDLHHNEEMPNAKAPGIVNSFRQRSK